MLEALDDAEYDRWLGGHVPGPGELAAMRRESALSWESRPLLSIVVPVFDPNPRWLEAMFVSVVDQTYDHWQLCVADDASTLEAVRATIRRWQDRDARIHAVYRTETGNIAAATNSALAMARGEFVAFVDHDDILAPHALHRVVESMQGRPEVDVLFSDEDKILSDGRRARVAFKGGFDPDHLLSTNYMSHLSVFRRALVEEVGGLRSGFDGSQDHDLALRVTERAREVVHIPDVLYSWRQVPGSTATEAGAKPQAWSSGLAAVQSALDRRAHDATAFLGPGPGTYTVRYRHPPLATHVILHGRIHGSLRRAPQLDQLRERGAHMTGVSWGFAVDEGSADAARGRATVLNETARASNADVLVFLAANLIPLDSEPNWLEPLLEQVLRPEVGACGGLILAADGSSEFEGWHVGADVTGVATCVRPRYPVIQATSAVSDACFAVRAAVFRSMGGFDERYTQHAHDVDLSLRLRRMGLRCIYTPLCRLQRPPQRRLRHSAGTAMGDSDRALLHALWDGEAVFTDPYASPWVEQRHPLRLRQLRSDDPSLWRLQESVTDHSPPNST
ncbi:MAG: glycosyltransferase family 2 protein [Candidatus Dormibacteria bacterium]